MFLVVDSISFQLVAPLPRRTQLCSASAPEKMGQGERKWTEKRATELQKRVEIVRDQRNQSATGAKPALDGAVVASRVSQASKAAAELPAASRNLCK